MIELKKGQKIVFDGDSLTALRNPPCHDQWPWLRITNSHRSWADVFSELLFAWRPDLALQFRTAAVGGDSMKELLARFDEAIAEFKPDWVFMTIGGNDARQFSAEEFKANLLDYSTRVNAWGGQVAIVSNFKPCPLARDGAEKNYEELKPFRDAKADLAAEHDFIHVINVEEGFHTKGTQLYEQYKDHNMYSDGGHFSHLGAMVVAGEVLKACGVVCT